MATRVFATAGARPPPSSRVSPAMRRVGASLGVGDEHAEAVRTELRRCGVEVLADAVEGSLHEEPARPGRALGEEVELLVIEEEGHLVAELTAAGDGERNSGRGERRPHLVHAVRYLAGVGRAEVGPDVGSGNHGA